MNQAAHIPDGRPRGPLKQRIAETVRRSVFDNFYSLAFSMLGDELEAEQLTEATVQAVLDSLAQRRLAPNPAAYFVQALRERFVIGPLTLTRPMFADVRNVREKRPGIHPAVLVLPVTERLLYLLHYGRGYSHREIGNLLDMPAWQSEIGCCATLMRIREVLATDDGMEA